MAIDRPTSSDHDVDKTIEQQPAEQPPPRDQPGTEPHGISRAESRRNAAMTTEELRQNRTEQAGEREPESAESDDEPSSDQADDSDADTIDEAGADDEDDQAGAEEPEEREPAGSGWDTPEYADHPHRPEHSDIGLSDDRRTHILDGEGAGRGGHRHGTGEPGKTEFPADWDDDTAVGHILDVARSPDRADFQKNGRWLVTGEREEVEIDVVVRPDGRIVTAYPLPGGRGVIKNPKESQ